MKIGILTFHTAANYGAVLQSYALTKVLKNEGANAELIDYDNFRIRWQYRLINLLNYKHPKSIICDILSIFKTKKRNVFFSDFRKNYLNISEKRYTEKNLPTGKDYDMVVTGSDQVWSFFCNGNDTHYFLDMIDSSVPCVSYAASMAKVELDGEEKQLYKNLLTRFLYISVREEQARDLLQPLTDKKIKISPDPTFLLKKEEWLDLVVNPETDNYIFAFCLGLPEEIIKNAYKLVELTGCKLVYMDLCSIKHQYRFGAISPCSPNEWLGYIKNAKYVVTDSFHGTAFSIIFQKNFISLTKNNAGRNTRIETLLKKLGLEERIVSGFCEEIPDQIDYKEVDGRLEELRKDGLSYIKELISVAEKGEF